MDGNAKFSPKEKRRKLKVFILAEKTPSRGKRARTHTHIEHSVYVTDYTEFTGGNEYHQNTSSIPLSSKQW